MNDQAFLHLLQIMDSQFPVGNFAHSAGIETYAALGTEAPGLADLLANEIGMGWGKLDLAACALAWTHAYDADRLDALGAELNAWKVIEISRATSVSLGRRTLSLGTRLFPEAILGLRVEHPHQAIVIGAMGSRLGASQRPLLLAFAQSQVTASLAAAVRCMPLSAERSQEILIHLQPALVQAVEMAAADPEAGLFASMPALDIRRQQQLDLPTRLFKS